MLPFVLGNTQSKKENNPLAEALILKQISWMTSFKLVWTPTVVVILLQELSRFDSIVEHKDQREKKHDFYISNLVICDGAEGLFLHWLAKAQWCEAKTNLCSPIHKNLRFESNCSCWMEIAEFNTGSDKMCQNTQCINICCVLRKLANTIEHIIRKWL